MTVLRLSSLLALPAVALGTAVASAATVPAVVAGVPAATGIRDLGRISATSRLNIAVSLGYRHRDELEALVSNQGDPESPLYHRFLKRPQFDGYFSPSAAAYSRIYVSLKNAGFTVTRTFSNRKTIDASAPAATVERYFATEIHRVAQTGAGLRYQNVRAAVAPADVSDVVSDVVGLANVGRFHTYNHFAPRQNRARPQLAVPGQLFGPDFGYGPTAYISGYDVPTKKALGKGQVSAVVIDADYLDSDLAAFLQYFGVFRSGPPTVRVPIDGGPPSGLTPDSIETTLDVQTIVSLAPATSLYVYEFPDFTNNQYIIDAYQQVVIDNFAGTVNSSFGGCESSDIPFTRAADDIALQGAALGITFHASSGDGGAFSGCPSVGVSSPASGPHFVAIGGTSLYLDPSNAKFINEFGWSGSGGGTSIIFKTPSYQKGVPGVIPSGRNVPDISFNGDPSTGASLYLGGAWVGPIGGTSLSSPIYGAAQTIVNQLRGSQAGFINPSIYKTFKKYGYTNGKVPLFRDITVGSNGFYAAKPGYDLVTGIGPEIVGNLASYVR